MRVDLAPKPKHTHERAASQASRIRAYAPHRARDGESQFRARGLSGLVVVGVSAGDKAAHAGMFPTAANLLLDCLTRMRPQEAAVRDNTLTCWQRRTHPI
uniref:Uncharacterized protein n=1 Tax=mine drainage metagenome TaxID=410659 RepID=E6PVD9_9ZZZZ